MAAGCMAAGCMAAGCMAHVRRTPDHAVRGRPCRPAAASDTCVAVHRSIPGPRVQGARARGGRPHACAAVHGEACVAASMQSTTQSTTPSADGHVGWRSADRPTSCVRPWRGRRQARLQPPPLARAVAPLPGLPYSLTPADGTS
eukprot:365107-Chlamydomonas_euryale.AAC.5